jgi:inorganic pyrophosphatase
MPVPNDHRNTEGSRNKVDYDPDSNLFRLGGPFAGRYDVPFDFRFHSFDRGRGTGDPLDIVVLMDALAPADCLTDVRVVGGI